MTLLPSSFLDLRLIFEDDDIHGLPILVDIKPDSPLLSFMKISYIKQKHHIISIGKFEPITSLDAINYLAQHQKRRHSSSCTVTLCPVDSRALVSEYETLRGYHDSMTHQVRHLVQSTTKPPCPKTFWDCIETEYKKDWIEACYKQYDKNMRVGMYSKPIPSQDLPAGVTILSSVLARKQIKQVALELWELCLCHCANSGKQKKGYIYDFSYSPIASV